MWVLSLIYYCYRELVTYIFPSRSFRVVTPSGVAAGNGMSSLCVDKYVLDNCNKDYISRNKIVQKIFHLKFN